MRKKIIGTFVVGILILTGFASISCQAGPALQPLTSPDPQIIDMIQQVNESLLYDYLNHLLAFGPRYTDTTNCTRAAVYIRDSFLSMGLDVDFHEWKYRGVSGKNVVATLPGTNVNTIAEYILCAHYDTVAVSPGAIDDGAGVAVVLAIAKILSQYSFNYTIRFIAFSGEEQYLYGSYIYAREVSQRGDNIVAVINMDYIGYAKTNKGGRTLAFFCPERSKWIADFAVTVNTFYRNQTNLTIALYPNVITYDLYSFVRHGFDGITVGDYEDNSSLYHTPFDTIDQVNWSYLAKITKLLIAVVSEIANTQLELQVIITKPNQGYLYFFNHPIFPLDIGRNNYNGMEGTSIIFGIAKLNADVTPHYDIREVIFCIDGYWISREIKSAPDYEWSIWSYYYFLFGKHSVEVYAYTTSGKVASDEMNVFFLFTP